MPRLGLCEWQITNVHSVLTVMLKNILRTLAEILKIFEKIQPQLLSYFEQKSNFEDFKIKKWPGRVFRNQF